MDFKLELIAADVGLEVRECVITYTRPRATWVVFRKLKEEERSARESDNDALCVVTGTREADAGVRNAFVASAVTIPSEGVVSPGPPFSDLPQHLQAFLNSVEKEFTDLALKTLRALRWYRNAAGPQTLIRRVKGWECSMNNQVLRYVTIQVAGAIWIRVQQRVDKDCLTAAAVLADVAYEEPLGHDLLHEAEALRNTSPRSSLVIAMTAAEIGFKEAVADLVPDARWLIQNVPAPPLKKMLTEYLPLLPIRGYLQGRHIRLPAGMLAVLKKGVSIRNTIVHKEPKDVAQKTLGDVLESVRELLYILDACRGQDWALARINNTVTRKELSSIIGGFPQRITIGQPPEGAAAGKV